MTRVFPLHMPSAVAADAHPAKPNIFRRLLAAVIESRRRRAEREIARYLAQSGLKFTDSVERDVERRLLFHRPFN
jgi:hypothetical protein